MRSSSYPTLSRVQRAALARARSLAAQYTHATAGRRLLIEAAGRRSSLDGVSFVVVNGALEVK